eukprot:COSAG01_NODE_14821_length_1406_cov_1.731446_1_plen_124_part_10
MEFEVTGKTWSRGDVLEVASLTSQIGMWVLALLKNSASQEVVAIVGMICTFIPAVLGFRIVCQEWKAGRGHKVSAMESASPPMTGLDEHFSAGQEAEFQIDDYNMYDDSVVETTENPTIPTPN